MKINDLATQLNIDARTLTMRTSKPRGCYLSWAVREVLLRDMGRLLPDQEDYLKALLLELVTASPMVAKAKSSIFESGALVMRDDHIQRLIVLYSRTNPFKQEMHNNGY